MQSSLVSVVIPTFNREPRMLGAALVSVLAQDVPALEVIVVDDGSATSAAQVVERYGEPVRFHEKQNGGIASARNAGVALCRGDLLAFLDSDDLWEPDKLPRQIEALRSAGLEAVFGQAGSSTMPRSTMHSNAATRSRIESSTPGCARRC